MGIDPVALSMQPQIAPLLRQCGILPARVIEVLQADQDEASQAVVALWDRLTPANRSLLGLEALSMAAGITPRRLWELYSGATMMQSRESLGVLIADSLPAIMRVTIKDAKKVNGYASREHIFKAARVLPTPKGSVINIGVPQAPEELPSGMEDDEQGGMLEGADDFLLRASRAMNPKALPIQSAIEGEVIEGDTDEDE